MLTATSIFRNSYNAATATALHLKAYFQIIVSENFLALNYAKPTCLLPITAIVLTQVQNSYETAQESFLHGNIHSIQSQNTCRCTGFTEFSINANHFQLFEGKL